MSDEKRSDEAAVLNTDRELYREDTGDPAGSYYENSVHVTAGGLIGMNVGGTVIVQPIATWHRQALRATTAPVAAADVKAVKRDQAEAREIATLRAYVQHDMAAFGAWCVDNLLASSPDTDNERGAEA